MATSDGGADRVAGQGVTELDPVELGQSDRVLLLRTGREAIAVRPGPPEEGWLELDITLVPELVKVFRGSGDRPMSMRVFAIHQDDLPKWDGGVRHGPDGWSWGTVWNARGKFDGPVRLREVQPTPAPVDPLALYTAVTTAQLRQQLETLTELVGDVADTLTGVVQHLQLEQESQVLTAVETITDVHARYIDTGQVGSRDWDRVVGPEQVIRQQHRQLLGELSAVATTLSFSTAREARLAAKVQPERVEDLLALETYLLRALARWSEVMLAAKREVGELQPADLDLARAGIVEYLSDAERVIEDLGRAQGHFPPAHWLQALLTDGIVGRRERERRIEQAATARTLQVRDGANRYRAITAPSLPQLRPIDPATAKRVSPGAP